MSNTQHQLGHILALKKKKKKIDPEINQASRCLTSLQGVKGTEEQIKQHYKEASSPVWNVGHPTK